MQTPLPECKVETRTSYFRRENDYVYKNICLLRNLAVKKQKGCKEFSLFINGIEIHPTNDTPQELIWNFEEVRYRIENCYDDNNMIRLNDTLVFNSIQALNHYSTVPPDEFDKTVFTQDIMIQIRPPNRTALVHQFEASEEVFESDVKLGIKKDE